MEGTALSVPVYGTRNDGTASSLPHAVRTSRANASRVFYVAKRVGATNSTDALPALNIQLSTRPPLCQSRGA